MKTLTALAVAMLIFSFAVSAAVSQEVPKPRTTIGEPSPPDPETPEPFNRVVIKDKDKVKIPASVDVKALIETLSQVRPPKEDWQAEPEAESWLRKSWFADNKLSITGWHTTIKSVEIKDGYTEVTAKVGPRVESGFGVPFVILGWADETYRIDSAGKVKVVERSKPTIQGFANY